jgi:hypothetical protein
MLLSTPLMAQSSVKIKSRVEIRPAGNQLQNSLNKSGSLPPTSYIANCSGTYLAWVIIAAKNSPPSEGPFSVAFRDKVRDTTMVFRLSDYINYRYSYSQGQECDFCNRRPDWSCTPISETAYHAYSTDPELFIMIPYILKGDTLKFSYDNCTQPVRMGAGMEFQFAKRDSIGDKCYSYMDGDLQELELCGIEFSSLNFSVSQDEDTLISGSSTMLYIYPPSMYYEDSLMTIEVDSAQYAKFIYDKGTSIDTLDSPMDSVKCSDAMSGKIKFLAMGKQPDKPVPVAICARYMFDPSKIFEDTIVVKGSEIMLGETKYYQAIPDPDNSEKLKFIEMSSTSGWTPGGQAAQFIVTAVFPTTKVGVYYELKDNDGLALAGDMIRLIGRYWNQDTTYSIKLSATSGVRTGSIEIEVKKPLRLLTPGQSPTYTLSRDVFDHEINIDSICIFYGGKYGIPPHFLKGQMLKESGKINYAGDKGFAPSYRYEPFSTSGQLSKAWKDNYRYNNGLWVVDPARLAHKMGNGKDVPDHKNVCDMPYPKEPVTVWQILQDHSELETIGSGTTDVSHRIYGSRNASGGFSTPYRSVNDQYRMYLFFGDFMSTVPTNVNDKYENARQKFIIYLRDEWNGGMQNMVAQTRLASSYGLLQMMYGTAVQYRSYPSRDPNISPEDLNVTDTNMTYSLKYIKQLLLNNLTSSVEEGGNWPDGFEQTFIEMVWARWNTGDGYPQSVYSNTQYFLPQSK